MHHKWSRYQIVEGCLYGLKVFCALCQDKHLTPQCNCVAYLGSNGFGSLPIMSKLSKNILDTCADGEFNVGKPPVGNNLQILWSRFRFSRRIPNRPVNQHRKMAKGQHPNLTRVS